MPTDMVGFLEAVEHQLAQQTDALIQIRRLLELHGEVLHRLERKLDQHFAAVEADRAGPAGGV